LLSLQKSAQAFATVISMVMDKQRGRCV